MQPNANERQLAGTMNGVTDGIGKLDVESTATVRIPALVYFDIADVCND